MIRKRHVAALLLVGMTIGTSGCASFPQKSFDPALRGQIQRIGIVTPGVGEGYPARLWVHPASSFGLVGAAIAEGDMGSKSKRLTAALGQRDYEHQKKLINLAEQRLTDAGYQVVRIPVNREAPLEFLEQYPPDTGVDAYLDMYTNVFGMMAAGASTPYRPTVYLTARLVAAGGSQEVLFADIVAFNAFGNNDDTITLTGTDAQYEFMDFDALMAGVDTAATGLDIALSEVVETMVRQLQ